MMGPTHQLIGAGTVIGAGLALDQPPATVGIVAAASLAASKLPDLDCRIPFIEHRGPVTHGAFTTLPIVALAALAVLLTQPPIIGLVAVGLAAGITLHLAADACTITGVSGWPFTRRIWIVPRRSRIVTGGWRKTRDYRRKQRARNASTKPDKHAYMPPAYRPRKRGRR